VEVGLVLMFHYWYFFQALRFTHTAVALVAEHASRNIVLKKPYFIYIRECAGRLFCQSYYSKQRPPKP